MAIIIHGGFFALIVFGVSWQVRNPAPVVAEIWNQLPPARNVVEPVPPVAAPEPEPAPPPVTPPVAKPPPPPSQADVELKAKREREVLAQKQAEQELLEKKKRDEAKAAELQKKALADKKRREDEAKQKAAEAQAMAEQEKRENDARAATNVSIREYSAKISSLIKGRANIPDTVSGKPAIQISLRLLVNGVVFDARVVKPSGNRVYDEAIERAINGIRQWPLPENPELFGGRRELILNIEHER
ncbi:MAG TPA: energy transducer TonB [Usitatibacteraceae bacterium]